MPYSPTNDAENIAQLGRDVKAHRANSGEQFCAFAFDLDHWLQLTPPVSERNRDECLTTDGGEPPKWLAAFFSLTDPMHTEQALLDKFEQWYSDYEGMYDRPGTLYIYSFLIQQCLFLFGWQRYGFGVYLALSVVLSAVAGTVSWFAVEMSAIRCGQWLVGRWTRRPDSVEPVCAPSIAIVPSTT